MFGLGFVVRVAVTEVAKACGVEEKTAKKIGDGAGWGTSIMTFDPSIFLGDALDVASNTVSTDDLPK